MTSSTNTKTLLDLRRHTFRAPQGVSDRLNHSTTHITAEVYSHVTQPIAKDAADLVGGLILGAASRSVPETEKTAFIASVREG